MNMSIRKKIAYLRSSNVYNDSRATKEILCLRDAGYEVTVLSWDRDGKEDRYFQDVFGDAVKNVSYKMEVIGGIGRKGIFKLFGFMRWLYRELNKYAFDAVHACDLDTGYSAYRYCQRRNLKLIYDIYDYYADCHGAEGVTRLIFETIENSIINYSELTIICTEERKTQIKNAKPKNLIVIYNSPDITETPSNVVNEYDYVYCGSLYGGRLLEEIFKEYKQNNDLRMCIAGRGALEEAARNCCCDNFTFLGSIPYSKVLEEESKAVAISAIYDPNRSRNNKLCAPNKFYEAMALSKPVIVCKDSGIDKVVSEEGIGMVIEYSSNEFYKALRYLKEHPEECEMMGTKGRLMYDSKYSWRLMKEKLLRAYSEVL